MRVLSDLAFVASLVPLALSAPTSESRVSAQLESRDAAGYSSPPYYPAPNGGWLSSWAEAYEKAQRVVRNMTLAEKVNLTTGTGIFMGPCVGQTGSALRFGIPNLCLQDSPLGVRNSDHNTAFPAGITVGATFDKDLMYDRGVELGEEFRGKGINVLLGPSVGPIGRKPRGGRNWEGFGADPSLQAIGGAQTIKGIQSRGVIATIKHYIGNEQEMYRMSNIGQRAYSSNIDDRTLHELYLWPFAEGVRAGVGAVMTAYNEVNSSACSQNSKLLNEILKDELGFQGFVMTDWLGQYGGVSSALAGLDMAMPGDGAIPLLGNAYWGSELSRSILNGSVPVSRLNDMVTRIVATWYKMGQDGDYPLPNFSTNTQDATGPLYPGALFSPSGVVNQYVNVQADHNITARAIARDAITLLKNDDNILPLKKNDSLKVFGTDAGPNSGGLNSCADMGCNKGVLTMGWGSGTSRLPYLVTPQQAIANISSNAAFYITDNFPSNVAVSSGDIAVVFISADSGENYITVEDNPGDRTSAGLNAWHNGDRLVKDAAAKFSKVVVVIHTVGPILMEEWIDLPSVKAVLVAHLPGQEAGWSLTDILFGDYSPSGHLPYTIPRAESDYPSSVSLLSQPIVQIQDTFTEGLYIDYRHFLKANITPRYPFGHGLSYTTFSFSQPTVTTRTALDSAYPPTRAPKGPTPTYPTTIPNLSEVAWPKNFDRIWRYLYPYLDDPSGAAKNSSKTYPYPTGYTTDPKPAPRAGGAEGGNPALFDVAFAVSITVTNTGNRPGRAVAQLYVELPDSLGETPSRQLRQFAKTKTLAPGASETLTMEITRKDISVWDVVVQDWKAPVHGEGVKIWLGENMGRYVPPDQEGLTTGNKLAGKHPLGARARHLRTSGALIVRFEMPFAVWCTTCKPHETLIGQGVRFNAEKKKVGNYYSTPVYSFRMKHGACGGWIEIRTDPANTAYVVVEGGRKRDTGDAGGIGEIAVGEDRKVKEDAFARLEGKVEDKRRAETERSRIEDLQRRQNKDWEDPYERSRRLRRTFRVERKAREGVEAKAEALRDKMSLGIELVEETEEDSLRAGMVDFGRGDDTTQIMRRRPLFDSRNGKREVANTLADRKALLRSELTGNTRAAVDPFLNQDGSAWRPEVKRRKTASTKGVDIANDGPVAVKAPIEPERSVAPPALVNYASDSD
ncbi:probable beta-glucosidase F [Aspergillus lentulus]|uniref:beta-glucosidase n=1 Tax=Aspergillus lentulus TaxID=293939 RepID=A0AAN4PAZ9_ASPLE|nr:probable beta-glucosidase F [Aspergillus lentulus]